ncbi:MAG: hypothetical protein AAF960_25550 [Bacteroidota bacterium]
MPKVTAFKKSKVNPILFFDFLGESFHFSDELASFVTNINQLNHTLMDSAYAKKKGQWQQHFREALNTYGRGESTFVSEAMPQWLLDLGTLDILALLEQRFGNQLFTALNPYQTIDSPVRYQSNSEWLKSVNMVGINVRTIGNFWNIVKYALSLPKAQSSIHILPIWEPGVVASLYGISSWHINREFFSQELQRSVPALNTVEKQLKVVVNILHLMGKTVGMDVIPHTDRYSEIVLANPRYFEWLQRREFDIVNHSANLHQRVEREIMKWLIQKGSANQQPFPTDFFHFFYQEIEEFRVPILFGEKWDLEGRIRRRNSLISHLYHCGLEPAPATMGPPYRGLEVDPNESAKTVDADGRVWRDYRIQQPQKFSRAFGPLTRFKLYERLDDNQNWEIDFNQPRPEVWAYLKKRYGNIQQEYHFDFMRGDMSHVQMRPNLSREVQSGLRKLDSALAYYDPHRAIKQHIQQSVPYFGYFAETFLAPPNTMAYGAEEDHLELSAADTTLGDLQSMPVGSPKFMHFFFRYYRIGQTRTVTPNFTIMTADKDDPRFDSFYLYNNITRLFIGLFLDLPSYMGLGFETRDIHPHPAPNERYTKLYVFQIGEGPKATRGPYRWGRNVALYQKVEQLKKYADDFPTALEGSTVEWLLPPKADGSQFVIAWQLVGQADFIFVVNLNATAQSDTRLGKILNNYALDFTTHPTNSLLPMEKLQGGEGRIYQLTS